MSALITLPFPLAIALKAWYAVLLRKGAYTMLNHIRELQKGLIPTPNHTEELAKIEQIFNKLKPKLECSGARLRCLLDVGKKLWEEVAEENFATGFALGWEIRKELQDAGVLSAHDGEDPGTVISEGQE